MLVRGSRSHLLQSGTLDLRHGRLLRARQHHQSPRKPELHGSAVAAAGRARRKRRKSGAAGSGPISSRTLIQVSVDATLRGRVLSIYGLIFRGAPALGALIMGAALEYVGLRPPSFVGALLVIAVWLWARPRQDSMMRSFE
jgi:MFS family permease